MKPVEQEIDELLDRLNTNRSVIETTIQSIAALLKATSRANEIIGLEYEELAANLRESQKAFKGTELVGEASVARQMRKYLMGLGFGLPPSTIPDEQGILMPLGEAERFVRISRERVEAAHDAFRGAYPKTRPAIQPKAGKTKHKWDNLEDKENHKDIAAAYIDSLLRSDTLVDVGQVATLGSKLMHLLKYPVPDPRQDKARAIGRFRSNANSGHRFLCEFGISINPK